MAKKRRRRKKSSNDGLATMSLKPGEVPTDEELETEAASLDSKLTAAAQKKYDKAKQEGYDLAALQHMKSKELGEKLKYLENLWVENNFNISEKEVDSAFLI
mgnify:CR=1 FL=1